MDRYFDESIGDWVYVVPELPDGWDEEDESWALYAEWSAGLWSDCRV